MSDNYVERYKELQAMRITELASIGLKANRGRCLGTIEFSAGEAEKLLRMMRRLKKAAKK